MTTSYFQRLRLIRRDAWLAMSAVVTLNVVQRGVFAVAFNLYLLRLGYGPQFIGLVNGLWLIVYAGLALPAGLLARRWGNRRLVILGKVIEATGFTLAALADLLPGPWRSGWLLGSYTLAGIGAAAWAPAYMALLYAACGAEERDHAFSVSTSSAPAAGFIGNLVGGVLPGLFATALGLTTGDAAPYRFTLLLAALVDFTAVPALLRTRDVQSHVAQAGKRERAPFPLAVAAIMSLCYLLQAAAYGPMMTFINVYLSTQIRVSVAAVGLILALARLIMIPASLTSPLLVARFGRFRALVILRIVLAGSSALLLILAHWLPPTIAFALAGACYLCLSAIGSVYGQELVAPEWRATITGSLSMAGGLGLGLVSLGGGYAIAAWGYKTLFAVAALFALASAGIFWAYFRVPRGELRAAAAAAAGE